MESSATTNLRLEEATPAGAGEQSRTPSPPRSNFQPKDLYKFLERDLGCCRSFLMCFLWCVWQHLLAMKGNVNTMITLNFSEEMLNDWSEQAKYDSMQFSVALVGRFGGIEPSETSAACFWVTPSRFDPW